MEERKRERKGRNGRGDDEEHVRTRPVIFSGSPVLRSKWSQLDSWKGAVGGNHVQVTDFKRGIEWGEKDVKRSEDILCLIIMYNGGVKSRRVRC